MIDTWITAFELSALAGISRQKASEVLRNAESGKPWRGTSLSIDWKSGRGGMQRITAVVSLPRDLQKRWALEFDMGLEIIEVATQGRKSEKKKQIITNEDRERMARRWALKSGKQKAEGERRHHILIEIEALTKRDIKKSVAILVAAEKNEVSESAIYKWFRQVKSWPRSDWSMILTANDKGRTKREELADQAWEYIKADYLRPEAPALTAVYERAARQGHLQNFTLPSYKTVLRRVNSIPATVRVLAREGVEALERMYPAQERDKSVFHALEAVNADGHKFDVFVDWGDGEIGRPLMAAWQDVYSGKFLGWRVAKTENSDTIRLSFGDMIETYGIPKHAYLDNGRGFASKWLTGGMPNRFRFKVKEDEPAGILTKLGVDVHWCTPYHGQTNSVAITTLEINKLVYDYDADHVVCSITYKDGKEVVAKGWVKIANSINTNNYTVTIKRNRFAMPKTIEVPKSAFDGLGFAQAKQGIISVAYGLGTAIGNMPE